MHPANDTLARLSAIATEAGHIALDFFHPGGPTRAGVRHKTDGSPVTEADMAVDAFLREKLTALWPGAAWLSEESVDDPSRLAATHVIIVDPIDGTRGFARGDSNWCVAAALVTDGRPVMAVVHAPALGDTYTAIAGEGAWLNGTALTMSDTVSDGTPPDMVVTCPGNLSNALRASGMAFDYKPKIASLALRVVMVASGVYTAGLTARGCHDWDVAAADLVLQEAGGRLADFDGAPLTYNRATPTHGMLMATPAALQATFREALSRISAR